MNDILYSFCNREYNAIASRYFVTSKQYSNENGKKRKNTHKPQKNRCVVISYPYLDVLPSGLTHSQHPTVKSTLSACPSNLFGMSYHIGRKAYLISPSCSWIHKHILH